MDDDSDLSKDKWGERREDRKDSDKEKKIKTAQEAFTMTCLNFLLYKINPLRFLYLDMEGWDTYALRGAGVALRGIDYT